MNVSPEPTELDYLDGIFSSIRTLSREIAAMKTWLKNAEGAGPSPWSLPFLAAARGAHERAHAYLENVEARLYELGPADEVPAPLDKLPTNVATMRADLRIQRSHLLRLESEAASR